MNRAALEHVIRAASAITNQRDLIVIGSQAVLGQFPDAPAALLASIEVDLYPRHAHDLSDVIDGAIGELSTFHRTFGYYAHGVDESTATLPGGWMERLVPIRNENTTGATGWCLEVHDLAAAKLAAGRERDLDYLGVLMREQMVDAAVLRARVAELPVSAERIAVVRQRLDRLEASAG